MNQNNDQQEFIYTYSAKDQSEIDRIRQKYTTNPKDDKIKRLHDLDASVHSRASAASIAVGTVGALIMGAGMSIVMTEFGQFFGLGAYTSPVGIAIGVVGLAIAICAYPLYRTVSERRRKKIAPEILSLLDELDRENGKKD
ncbi:MAG: hypothetical protein E7594_03485 [Ruminococcaceae bacterium]|nr:hypothetical protein [Oscillospiraceae bacterium]